MAIKKEWTIMFYFASDNPLAPSVVSQLKAITSAGFHQDVNVIARFDPHTEGTDTHVFDVNIVNKLIQKSRNPSSRYKFWGENDPFIRNLVFDKLWSKGDTEEGKIRESVKQFLEHEHEHLEYVAPDPRNGMHENQHRNGGPEPGPKASLESFLQFCADSYPAERYMLFMLGHGLVVGNDMFLYDENGAERSLSLKNLAAVLENFTASTDQKLDLIGFHSCSMSSIEVAFELRDTVKYMLASQGPAFVGSWPYREILIRVFNDLITNQNVARKKTGGKSVSPTSTIEKIFEYVLRNSYDFQLAGYSFDLCLSNLEAVDQIASRIRDLSMLLTNGLKANTPFVQEAIHLAHLDSQSFWQESYTDLYDFCWCLRNRCNRMIESCEEAEKSPDPDAKKRSAKKSSDPVAKKRPDSVAKRCLDPIAKRCTQIITALESDLRRASSSDRPCTVGNGTIVRTAFAGPQYQYSHGLSVYFPWSEPTNRLFWHNEYKYRYAFAYTGWGEFLQTYFDVTQRQPVWKEIGDKFGVEAVPEQSEQEKILETITCRVFNEKGPLHKTGGPGTLANGDEKPSSDSALGNGDEKPSSDSALGNGDEKPSSDSALGNGDEKPSSDSALGNGDEKPSSDSALGGSRRGPVFGMPGSGGVMLDGDEKPGSDSSTGGGCACSSIKNFPSFTRERVNGRTEKDRDAKPASKEFFDFLVPKQSKQ